jgi:hypothetical protein
VAEILWGMAMIRPAAIAVLTRWGELALAGVFAFLGLTIMALAWGWNALGRARFVQAVNAPGLVELDEAELTYFSPGSGAGLGGGMGLDDVQEIRLVTLRGRRLWWLRAEQARPLLIPVEAEGNAALFDAFCGLPGLSPTMLLHALEQPAVGQSGLIAVTPAFAPVWRRPASGLVRS